ncbi:PE-PGRS family protein, partial [Mycobacterium kansasii]
PAGPSGGAGGAGGDGGKLIGPPGFAGQNGVLL